MAFKKLSILPLPGHILHNNKMSRYPRTVLYLASFFVCIFNVKITRVLLICRSIRAIFPRFRSYTGQFSSTSPGMKWQVNINLTFIRLALISLLTYLLKLLYVAPHNTIGVCRAQPARRRRPRRRRARHQQPVDINHRMEQLVATVATQCPPRQPVGQTPQPPAYQQVCSQQSSRSPSRSPPRSCRRDSIFYSD